MKVNLFDGQREELLRCPYLNVRKVCPLYFPHSSLFFSPQLQGEDDVA